jgi:hypothetical protein
MTEYNTKSTSLLYSFISMTGTSSYRFPACDLAKTKMTLRNIVTLDVKQKLNYACTCDLGRYYDSLSYAW